MGRVWLLVLLSMCLTLAASMVWHVYEVKKGERLYKADNEIIVANTIRIATYRDVLKEKGIDGATLYLQTLSRE